MPRGYDPPPNPHDEPDDQYTPERVGDAVRIIRRQRMLSGRSRCCGAEVKVDEVSGRSFCAACLEWL